MAHRNLRKHRIAIRFALAPSGWKVHANYFWPHAKAQRDAKLLRMVTPLNLHLSTLIGHRSTFIFQRSPQNFRTSEQDTLSQLSSLIIQRSTFIFQRSPSLCAPLRLCVSPQHNEACAKFCEFCEFCVPIYFYQQIVQMKQIFAELKECTLVRYGRTVRPQLWANIIVTAKSFHRTPPLLCRSSFSPFLGGVPPKVGRGYPLWGHF